MSGLSKPLLTWSDRHGRHDLPWQHERTAYRVWLSEIMLQQTQVQTVIPYFNRFVEAFPDVAQLASAPLDEVLHLWSGLGYYARARNLHRTANTVVDDFGGEFPRDINAMMALPGIGRSTAGAILALVHGDRHPILDGNVKRVLARYHEIAGWPGETRVAKLLWAQAEAQTPNERVDAYTQAIMDLGATLCTRNAPRCPDCPLQGECAAFSHAAQNAYPGRKPRKTLPEKRARCVVARAGDRFLLQRRPLAGIWGGLWSFPELGLDEGVQEWCANRGLTTRDQIVTRSESQHTFTHFRLTITPLEIEVERGAAVMDSEQWLWYNVDEPDRIGLARPVTVMVERGERGNQ